LLGVLKEDTCAGGLILGALKMDIRHAISLVEWLSIYSRNRGEQPQSAEWGGVAHTVQAKAVMDLCVDEANLFTPTYPIGTEHMLLALLRVPDGTGCRALNFLGFDEELVRAKRDELWKLLPAQE
jgi:hypothetical protein